MNMMSCTSFLNRDTQYSCVLWCKVMNQGVGGYDEGAWRLLGNGPWSGEEAEDKSAHKMGKGGEVLRDEHEGKRLRGL